MADEQTFTKSEVYAMFLQAGQSAIVGGLRQTFRGRDVYVCDNGLCALGVERWSGAEWEPVAGLPYFGRYRIVPDPSLPPMAAPEPKVVDVECYRGSWGEWCYTNHRGRQRNITTAPSDPRFVEFAWDVPFKHETREIAKRQYEPLWWDASMGGYSRVYEEGRKLIPPDIHMLDRDPEIVEGK